MLDIGMNALLVALVLSMIGLAAWVDKVAGEGSDKP